MATSRSRSNSNLEPPRKSVELIDPGARSLASSEDEEYFSDASEGRKKISRPATPASPIPRTRVEKVDDTPSHGQIPGSFAYEQRLKDAVPDEVEVIPEVKTRPRSSTSSSDIPRTPGGTMIPRTVVEKIDPMEPSYGDVPGTEAYAKRLADSAPDVILKAPEPGQTRPATYDADPTPQHNFDIPETVVTRVETRPAHGEVEGTSAFEKRREDAQPDDLRVEGDISGSPTLDRPMKSRRSWRRSSHSILSPPPPADPADAADDFDDFEEGDDAAADDDFGDFDNAAEEEEVDDAAVAPGPSSEPEEPIAVFPLIDFSSNKSTSDLLAATKMHFDAMFPNTTTEKLSELPPVEPLPADSPIFPSERSRSLWKQLVTPPPLQPPNWTKSRIRRLFLVSLGVPVDLDEILPPSKQKKLVLPDVNLEPSSRKSESDKAIGSVARLKARTANDSTGSVDSTQSGPKVSRRRPKGPPPPPDLDLSAVKRLCATTNEKLDGMTDDELQMHLEELRSTTTKTSEVLEFWLKRRDGALTEKEAFEGVIENLVKHARRVRK